MFDSNAMAERAAIKRAQGGGRRKDGINKPVSSKAYDERQGYQQMTPWEQLVYRTNMLWRQACSQARSDFKWDCHVLNLDTVNGEIPF